mgnify:FL=1
MHILHLMNLTNDLHFCKIQTLIPIDNISEKLQQLKDIYGNYNKINRQYTCFQHANLTVRIDEDPDADDDVHTIVTLGELKRAHQEGVTIQHALRSQVHGNIHKFISLMGQQPTMTWIERGYQFNYETISIKIFEVLTYEKRPIDSLHFAVSIEGFAQISQQETNNICQQIFTNYNTLFGSIQPFIPTDRKSVV